MRPSSVSTRRPVQRELCALVTLLAFASWGCAVHRWQPARSPDLGRLEGRTVRTVAATGDVELKLVSDSYPYLTGRFRAGTGRISVDVAPGARVDVRRCAASGGAGMKRGTDPADDLSRLAGCDVEIATAEGRVALHVEAVPRPRELSGRALGGWCSERQRPCRGALVRVDRRECIRVDERRFDGGSSIGRTAAVVLIVGLVGLGAWAGTYIGACVLSSCPD